MEPGEDAGTRLAEAQKAPLRTRSSSNFDSYSPPESAGAQNWRLRFCLANILAAPIFFASFHLPTTSNKMELSEKCAAPSPAAHGAHTCPAISNRN